MAIEQIQRTHPGIAGTPKTPGTGASQPQAQPSSLKMGDTVSLTAEVAKPQIDREVSGGSHKLPYPQGSASGNLLIYFNSRTHEPQLLPVIKGNIGMWHASGDDSKEGVVSLGLSLAGNGLTTIGTIAMVETIIDRDYDEDQHMRLDVEFGFSHIRDEESWDPSNKMTYNAARIGVNFAPHPNINLVTGFDMSSMVFSPYIGLGGRWQSKDR